LAVVGPSNCLLLIGAALLEKRRRYIEATTANIWVNISSTKSNCICFVRVLAIRGIVEPVVDLCVGVERGEEVVEVSLIPLPCVL
jgi:hypothetical protein